MNNQTFYKVKCTKFIWVIIDEYLNWAEHINTVKTKISRGIAILCKARRVLKTSTLVTLHNSFVYPYIDYCIEVWGGASDKYIKSLFKAQKRAVRIIKSTSYFPTRHAHNLRVAGKHKTKLSEQSIRTAAISIWNHILYLVI